MIHKWSLFRGQTTVQCCYCLLWVLIPWLKKMLMEMLLLLLYLWSSILAWPWGSIGDDRWARQSDRAPVNTPERHIPLCEARSLVFHENGIPIVPLNHRKGHGENQFHMPCDLIRQPMIQLMKRRKIGSSTSKFLTFSRNKYVGGVFIFSSWSSKCNKGLALLSWSSSNFPPRV